MINFSIFKKDNKNSFFHRQQVSERGLLERIDKILDEISEEGLKEIFEVEERLKHIVNDPRTRIAMSKFSKEAKTAVKSVDVTPEETPKKTKQTSKKTYYLANTYFPITIFIHTFYKFRNFFF